MWVFHTPLMERVGVTAAVVPEADLMEVVEVVGMVGTLAEATIMEGVIMVAMADTITEGMRQAGPYSELFWVE